jgi:hypothetical protein
MGIGRQVRTQIDGFLARKLKAYVGKKSLPAVNILLESQGYNTTVETRLPLDGNGSPIPWYTYPAIEYFNQIDAKDLKIFEYGSGNSSLYWARKGALVWSVEHDEKWFEQMNVRSGVFQTLQYAANQQDYAAAVDTLGIDFDVVIVDGAWRYESVQAGIKRLNKGGIVILDNADWHADAAKFLRSNGFFQLDFNGFGPINNYCWTTSIFLPLQSPFSERIGQPHPIGGIIQRGS